MTLDDLTLDITQSIDIKADIGDVFRSVLHRLGEGMHQRARRIDADDTGSSGRAAAGSATAATASATCGDTCR